MTNILWQSGSIAIFFNFTFLVESTAMDLILNLAEKKHISFNFFRVTHLAQMGSNVILKNKENLIFLNKKLLPNY